MDELRAHSRAIGLSLSTVLSTSLHCGRKPWTWGVRLKALHCKLWATSRDETGRGWGDTQNKDGFWNKRQRPNTIKVNRNQTEKPAGYVTPNLLGLRTDSQVKQHRYRVTTRKPKASKQRLLNHDVIFPLVPGGGPPLSNSIYTRRMQVKEWDGWWTKNLMGSERNGKKQEYSHFQMCVCKTVTVSSPRGA